jgi:hypothetical protein
MPEFKLVANQALKELKSRHNRTGELKDERPLFFFKVRWHSDIGSVLIVEGVVVI